MGNFRYPEAFGKRCPALVERDGVFRCALVEQEPILGAQVAIGAGCSSTLFNTAREKMMIRRKKKENSDGQTE
jgi:hypothetical protein